MNRLFVVVLGLVCGAALAGPPNLVPNSGAEEGAERGKLPAGWSVWRQHPGMVEVGADAEVSHSGRWSVKVRNHGTGGANVTVSSIPCKANTQYTLSVYVRTDKAAESAVTLGAKGKSGSIINWSFGGTKPVPATTDWVRISHTITTPDNCAYLTPHLTNRGGTVWWDDCQLEQGTEATHYVDSVPPEPPDLAEARPGVNAIPDPGFEEDPAASGWQMMSDSGDETGQGAWDRTEPHGGTHALKLQSVSKTRQWQSPLIRVDAASSYRLSGWLRTVGLEGRADVFLECYGRWLTRVGSAGYDGGVYAYDDCPWTKRYAPISPSAFPRGTEYARVVCRVTGTVHAKGEAWFDDLELVMAPATMELGPRDTEARHATHIFPPNAMIPYELAVHVPGAAGKRLTVDFKVTDYFGKECVSDSTRLLCDAECNARADIDIPALNALGHFTLTVSLRRSDEILGTADASFGTTEFDRAKWAPDRDSRFGICHIKSERMYPLAQIAGMKWTRGGGNPSWSRLEPKQGEWTWDSFERDLAKAKPYGIHKLPIMSGLPGWATQGEDEFFTFFRHQANKRYFRLPKSLDDFENYIFRAVERYRDQFTTWEIWNEADIAFWQGTDEEYIQLMQAAYRGAKRADPDCQVSMTGMAYTSHHVNRTGRVCDGQVFLEKCLKLAPNEFDIVNFHSYGGVGALNRKLDEITALMEKYNCTKPLWITETGMPTHLRGASEQDQARYCAHGHAIAFARGVDKVFWHCFWDWGQDPNYHEHHFGLIHYDYSPKPAYMVYCAMTRMLDGAEVVGNVDLGPGLQAVAFRRDNTPITMVWSEKDDRSVLLRLDEGNVNVRDIMGNAVSAPSAMGLLSLRLTPDPVYVMGAGILSSPSSVARLEDRPVLRPGESCRTALHIQNVFASKVTVDCRVRTPAGWTFAPNVLTLTLPVGETKTVPVTLTAPETLRAGSATILCDLSAGSLEIPGLEAGGAILALPLAAEPKAIAIDGDLSEWPARSALVAAAPDRIVYGNCSGDADLHARFWVAADDNALFVAADIRDDWVANNRRFSEPWNGDGIELFLDLRKEPELGKAAHGAGVYQFFLIPPDQRTPQATWLLWKAGTPFSSALDLSGERSANGYTLEARIPWTSFGRHAPQPGQAIGIDLCVDDADSASQGRREAQMAWAGTVRNHVDASGFARALRAQAPSPIAATSAGPVNLAPNPGFETDLDNDGVFGKSEGWYGTIANWEDTTGSWVWDREVAHSGKASLCIRNVTTHRVWESMDMSIRPGQGYKASAWIKTEDLGEGTARVYVSCYDAKGKWVGNAGHSERIGGTNDWQLLELRIKPDTCPGDAVIMRLDLALGKAPNGTVWFDDVTLSATPE